MVAQETPALSYTALDSALLLIVLQGMTLQRNVRHVFSVKCGSVRGGEEAGLRHACDFHTMSTPHLQSLLLNMPLHIVRIPLIAVFKGFVDNTEIGLQRNYGDYNLRLTGCGGT